MSSAHHNAFMPVSTQISIRAHLSVVPSLSCIWLWSTVRLHPLKLVYSILVLIANERAAHKPYTAKGHGISWLEEKLFHSLKSSNKLMSTVSLYAARGWYTGTAAAAVQHPSSVSAAQELWVSCTGAECKRHERGAGAEWELHESCA